MTIDKEIKNVPLGTYLFTRLSQVPNFKSVFGVPGDFNLPLLEHIYNVKDMNWVGNCNELNAGYAADGYARINGFGALITTFGVGELSALNAINGSFVENVPVLHIVGTSSTEQKRTQSKVLHHLVTPADSWNHKQNHFAYENIVDSFSIIKASLDKEDLESIQDKVDNVIETIYKSLKPGYLFIPVDMADVEIPVDVSKKLQLSQIDENLLQTKNVADKIIQKLESKNFALLADSLIKPQSFKLNSFISTNKIHCFTTTLGKGALDELTYPELFHGTYNGKLSTKGTIEDLEQFDLILHLGYNFNEINNFQNEKVESHVVDVIEVGKDFVKIDGQLLTQKINGLVLFEKILEGLDGKKVQSKATVNNYQERISKPVLATDAKITQQSILENLQSIIQPDDILVIEMCSFIFSIPEIQFPKNVRLVCQNFYGSIGYALPATLGVSLAVRDSTSKGRVILIEGDGSAQMTIQELTSYVRYDIKPLVLLLNNEGYTVERAIMGETSSYNDIAPNWNWTQLFKVFGDINGKSESVRVESNGDLMKQLNKQDGLKLIEVALQKLDVPWRFEYICGKKKF